MSVRNLGDWSHLGRGGDPVRADLDKVQEAGVHYRKVATTIDDAVSRLDKILSGAEGLQGEYADQVRDDAQSVRESLQKAGVRYGDVADQIAIYVPELTTALDETRTALDEATAATGSLSSANAMPEGAPGEDGQLPEEERAKEDARSKAVTAAQDGIAQARRRMDTALGALDVAGKRFGDAVNCKRYDDGLSDTLKDKILAVLDKISKVLTIIAMVLGVLCLFFPGIAALVVVAAVTTIVSLGVTATLYANGEEGLPDLIFSVLGVVTLGAGTAISLLAKSATVAMRGLARQAAWLPRLRIAGGPPSQGGGGFVMGRLGRPVDRPAGSGAWQNQSDWFNNPLTNALMRMTRFGRTTSPEVGFWKSSWEQVWANGRMWKNILTNPRGGLREWAGAQGGWTGMVLPGSAGAMSTLEKWCIGFGGGSTLLTLGTGLGWAGGRYTEDIPVYLPREVG